MIQWHHSFKNLPNFEEKIDHLCEHIHFILSTVFKKKKTILKMTIISTIIKLRVALTYLHVRGKTFIFALKH